MGITTTELALQLNKTPITLSWLFPQTSQYLNNHLKQQTDWNERMQSLKTIYLNHRNPDTTRSRFQPFKALASIAKPILQSYFPRRTSNSTCLCKSKLLKPTVHICTWFFKNSYFLPRTEENQTCKLQNIINLKDS